MGSRDPKGDRERRAKKAEEEKPAKLSARSERLRSRSGGSGKGVLLDPAPGSHNSPLPFSGRSEQDRSQSPDPVESSCTSCEESMWEPDRGPEILANG